LLIIQSVLKNPETIPDLDLLETVLAYNFKDRALLERAITHRSWAHEKVAPGDERQARKLHNESLEFLGDSVLGLVVSNYLCSSYPGGTEGELSRMKHRLVSAPTLAKASLGLNLGDFLRFGRGEEKSGGRQKNALLADVFEAITGEAATRFVCHALRDELEGADPLSAAKADYKTMLQERLQASRRPAPRYAVIETLGPPHQRIFHVEVSWDGGSIQGEGHSIKAAEAAAARAALEGMKLDESENGDESPDDPCSST
jgi:ribonuclease-3